MFPQNTTPELGGFTSCVLCGWNDCPKRFAHAAA